MGKSRNFVRLTGRFHHVWVRDVFKTNFKELEAKEQKDPQGEAITLLTGAGPVIAVVGDHDFLIAGFFEAGKNEEAIDQALALRTAKQPNAATGVLKAKEVDGTGRVDHQVGQAGWPGVGKGRSVHEMDPA